MAAIVGAAQRAFIVDLQEMPAAIVSPVDVPILSAFLLDLFEQACSVSLLTPSERLTFQILVGRGLKMSQSNKKKRIDDSKPQQQQQQLLLQHQQQLYSAVLPAEYLLRLLAGLPMLVHHFLVKCGGDQSARFFSCESLWIFSTFILGFVDRRSKELITPRTGYASFVDAD